jgi:thymidylate synthase (FAD)
MFNPVVFPLAETCIDREGLNDFLSYLGAGDFQSDALSDSELLIEVAGRLCYQSFKPGLNPNVTKVRQGNENYIGNILASGHGSVLEHATVSFGILDVSPVLTHELVRHRAGTAFSQISGRYVRVDRVFFYWPEAFAKAMDAGVSDPARLDMLEREGVKLLEQVGNFQRRLATLMEIDNIRDFTLKKALTSAFRRFLPYGLKTGLVFTANHRALRHIVAIRNDIYAEEEIRKVAFAMGVILKDRFPAIYQDMVMEDVETTFGIEQVWRFKNSKV